LKLLLIEQASAVTCGSLVTEQQAAQDDVYVAAAACNSLHWGWHIKRCSDTLLAVYRVVFQSYHHMMVWWV